MQDVVQHLVGDLHHLRPLEGVARRRPHVERAGWKQLHDGRRVDRLLDGRQVGRGGLVGRHYI